MNKQKNNNRQQIALNNVHLNHNTLLIINRNINKNGIQRTRQFVK